ncbi:Hpt domain-containing protein [uncultured Brevundimonas sp.]|uniref:Hpt domain-containing protein n=1 Tax=uncultured Brevundimonas sp. TaxID=213418 RepID=UPI0030EB35CB
MARRDLSGAVDFAVLGRMTGDDDAINEEVLGLFVQQAGMWAPMLDVREDGWRDGVHTIRGAAAGIGAVDLANACAVAEAAEKADAPPLLNRVQDALDTALADVAAFRHELMLRSLRGGA